MISNFTKKELQEISKEFRHWDLDKNSVWVQKELDSKYNSKYVIARIEKLDFIKTKSQLGWAKIKFNQVKEVLDESPYTKSRYENYSSKFRTITQELEEVISLRQCEFYKSEFIDGRIERIKFETAEEELDYRLRLLECEKHTNAYVKKRIKDFDYLSWSIFDEITQRIKLRECAKHNTRFISSNYKYWMKKSEFEFPEDELDIRIILESCEVYSTPSITERIKKMRAKDLISDVRQELKFRIALNECEKYSTDFINEGVKIWGSHSVHPIDVTDPYDELNVRLDLLECEKWSTKYVDEELKRIRDDEFLVRDIREELKLRIKLFYYEDKADGPPETIDDSKFWQQISVHGMHSMKKLRKELDKVGKGFCLAKWNQVSILLQTGQTHSCHHPRPHQVPLAELENNPSALHNTYFKKMQRKTMLKGGRPAECDYCWNVEDSNPESISDRVLKSGEGWAFPYFNRIKKSNWEENVQPSYVEVSFSNQCNMCCSYCDVKSSSNWQHEIATKGHYPTSGMYNNIEWMERDGIVPIPHTKPNPYRDAFWKWWPDLFPSLHTFRITGGEPLLHKDTFKVLDYIIENPKINPQLEMSINSNLNIPNDKWEEFIDKVQYITDKDLVWNFTLFTSIEAGDMRAQYIRDGLEADRFWNNVDDFLTRCQKPATTIMATYNLMSVSSYDKVIKKVFELKKKHYNAKRYRHYAIILDTSYLRHPEFMQIRLLGKEWIDKIRADVDLMESLSDEKYIHIHGHGHSGFYDFEREKLRRVLDWCESPLDDVTWLMKMRKDFGIFIDEYDKRRGKNFLETFPEMEDFYNSCKKLV
jgi:organic radical activating enzyme